jgi:3-dehydroquinate synthase
MVDASVGGKTAVNLPEGKNLVGAFWQPRAVLADVETLRTLPPQQFRQGAVELFKHGLLADPALLARFDDGLSAGSPPAVLADAVARSVAVKAEVVAGDEREAGARAYLNLGHTLAHALEAVSDHALGHGDAVAYGLAYAALLARARGWADLMPRVRRLLAWLEPAPLPAADFAALEPYLDRDKKAAAGRRRFVLLEDVGRPRLVDDVPHTAQVEAWSRLREIPEVAA